MKTNNSSEILVEFDSDFPGPEADPSTDKPKVTKVDLPLGRSRPANWNSSKLARATVSALVSYLVGAEMTEKKAPSPSPPILFVTNIGPPPLNQRV
jgi:hypothetical protein